MKRGGTGSPYRAPAGGWPARTPPYIQCHQNKDKSKKSLPLYVNSSADPFATGTKYPTAHAPTISNPCGAGPAAGCSSNVHTGTSSDAWFGKTGYIADGCGGEHRLVNTFTQSGTRDMSGPCAKRGGKWVKANRTWHGSLGFFSPDTGPTPINECAYSNLPNTYKGVHATAQQVKYLGFSFSLTISQAMDCTIYQGEDVYATSAMSGSITKIREISVEPNSGLITLDAGSDTNTAKVTNDIPSLDFHEVVDENVTPFSDDSIASAICSDALNIASLTFPYFGDSTTIQTQISDFWKTQQPPIDVEGLSTSDNGSTVTINELVISNTRLRLKVTIGPMNYSAIGDMSVESTGDIVFDLDMQLSVENNSSGVYSDCKSLLGYWDLTDDIQYPWRTDNVTGASPIVSRDEPALPVSPVVLPLPALKFPDYSQSSGSFIDWIDPDAYKWLKTSATPDVYIALDGAAPTGGNYYTLVQTAKTGKVFGMPMPRAFYDSDSALYTGASPITGAVFEDFFDYRAAQYAKCPSGSEYACASGQWLSDVLTQTDAQIPKCATQWDTRIFDSYGYDCAYVSGASIISCQKWAEILEEWPSQNFARPAGVDKFALDETKAIYFVESGVLKSSSSGSPVTLWSPPSGIGVWGGKIVDGFYESSGTSTDGSGNLILGTKLFDVPSDWNISPSVQGNQVSDVESVFGPLRWQNSTPAILGRIEIGSMSDGGTGVTILNIPACTTLGMAVVTLDKIDFFDSAMSAIQTAKEVTRISDTQFSIAVDYADVSTAVYIASNGAADYKWDDNGSKYDFVHMEWLQNNRIDGEIVRYNLQNDCTGSPVTPLARPALGDSGYRGYESYSVTQHQYEGYPTPCQPPVACVSPNGEDFSNGVTIGFPSSFNFDTRYEANWFGSIEQVMPDLLWQAPHQPYDTDIHLWAQDGSCSGSGCALCRTDSDPSHDYYYAMAPLIEFRITLPSGAPTLPTPATDPTPLTLTPVSPIDVASGGEVPPIGYGVVWGVRIGMENCSCPDDEGRFPYKDINNLDC